VGFPCVFHSPSDLLVYEYDGSVEGAVDQARPIAVVLPRAAEQVAAVVKIGKRSGLPIIPRGAGTGLSGGAVAQSGGIIVALTRVAEVSDPGKARLDIGGAALATVGLGAATYGLTLWSEKFALTATAGMAMAAGAALLIGFVLYERRLGDKAMVPLALFKNRCFTSLNLMTFLLYGAFGGAMPRVARWRPMFR